MVLSKYYLTFWMITPFVGAQADICKAFGIDIPKGCEPNYKSKKPGKKRGRPRKNP